MKTLTTALRTAIRLVAALALFASAIPSARADVGDDVTDDVTDAQAYAIAREGYDFYLPLLLMDLTRRLQTTVAAAGGTPRVPADGFWHWRTFPDGAYREIVRPNFDTLYSMTWLDLSRGPVTLGIPAGSDRYHVLPLMDMWTDVFAVLGSRTIGRAGGRFTIVGPNWQGQAPEGGSVIRAPTDGVWIIARTQTNGPADYAHVRALQDGLTISAPAGTPPVVVDPTLDRVTPPITQVARMTARDVFAAAARLSARQQPHLLDQPVLARLARIGFRPGQPFDLERQPASRQAAIRRGVADAFADIKNQVGNPARNIDGWTYDPANMAAFGGDYHLRAIVAYAGLGANRPEDAVYPEAFTDDTGSALDGRKTYVLHFAKGQLPPIDAFWSLTAYDRNGFPIQTPTRKYSVGDRDPLIYNADGSLNIVIGARAPEKPGMEANWLPTLGERFSVVLRLYQPRDDVTSGRWRVPAIREEAK